MDFEVGEDLLALAEKEASKYAQTVRSERDAFGRTKEQKLVDGIMAGNAFYAGFIRACAILDLPKPKEEDG